MKPEIQRIFTKLAKEKVELGSVQQLKNSIKSLVKSLNKADNSWRDYSDYLTRADKPFGKMIESYRDLDSSESAAKMALNSFNKSAKDLGVDVSNSKEVKELENLIKESKNIFSVINSFKDPSSFQN